MKKYIILLILQCCTHLVFAQYPSLYWAKSFGGNSQFMSGQSMAVDASGNVYVAGIFSGDCDFDPSINQFSVYSKDGGKDVFVSKFNSSGQLIWAKTVGGIYDESVCGVAVDVSGNVYLAGQLGYAGDYDPGPAVLTLTSAGESDIFYLKLDPAGNLIWAKRIGGSYDDLVRSMVLDNAGNMYTTGSFRSSVDFDPGTGTSILSSAGNTDIYVSKLDSSGNLKWVRRAGSNSLSVDAGYAIRQDASGNLLIAGCYTMTADFNPGSGVANLSCLGYSDMFVWKLTENGNYIWAKSFGSNTATAFTNAKAVTIDVDDNIYVMGTFSDTVDFDPDTTIANLSTTANSAVFVLKLNTTGSYVWAETFVADYYFYCNSLADDGAGNLYLTGSFLGKVDFDPGAGNVELTASTSYEDIFICKLDSAGTFEWAHQMGGGMWDVGNCIITDASDNIYTTGYFRDTIDASPGPGSHNLLSGVGSDVYMLKMNAFPSGVSDLETDKALTVYPNPSDGIFLIRNELNQMLTLRVLDVNGRLIFSKNNITDASINIDLSSQADGIYMIELLGEGKRQRSKISKHAANSK